MHTKTSLILLLLTIRWAETKSSVLSVFKISRHGARAPNGPLQPEFIKLGALETADLTYKGKKQLKSLGRKFKQRYSHFRSFETSFYSSYKKRAIYSMFSFIQHFMHGKKTHKHIMNEAFFHSNDFKKFNNEQLAYLERKKPYIERIYTAAVGSGLQEAIEAYCTKCVPPHSHIKKLKLLKHMFTQYYCRKGNNVERSKFNPRLVRCLTRAQMLFYDTVLLHESYIRTENHGLYMLLGKQLVHVLQAQGYKGANLAYYSQRFDLPFKVNHAMYLFAHDRNVLGLIAAIVGKKTVFKNSFYMPKFASYITVELMVDHCKGPALLPHYFMEPDEGTDYYVKLKYQDREVFTKACGYSICTVNEFLEFLDKNLDV